MKRFLPALVAILLAGAALLGREAHAQQAAGSIRITAPAANAAVSGPVTLTVDIQGVTVRPASEGDPAAFHYHALVDVDPATVVQPGQPLPTGQANIIHTADRTITIPDLAPGQHTIVVILTRTDHVPLNPSVQDRVTFTVTSAPAGQTAPAGTGAATLPRVGAGGGLDADNRASPRALATLAAVLALGSGVLAHRARRRGA